MSVLFAVQLAQPSKYTVQHYEQQKGAGLQFYYEDEGRAGYAGTKVKVSSEVRQ